MGFPDQTLPRQLLKVGGKFVVGGGPGGGPGGLRRRLPFKRAAALPPLPGAGRGLGKFVFVAGKAPDGRRGRALRFFPFAFGKRPGQQARRGGAARRPAPRARGPQEAEDGGRGAGARGARTPGAGSARLARRAEQARGPAEERGLWSSRSWRRRRGGGGEALPPGEHGAPGAQAAAAGAPVAG